MTSRAPTPAPGGPERLLGWQAQYDITEGIRHSLQWAALRDEMLRAETPVRDASSRRFA